MTSIVDARRCQTLYNNFCDMTISVENVNSDKISMVLNAFRDVAIKCIVQGLSNGSDLDNICIPLVVGSLNFKEREELEDILKRVGGWIPVCGDRWLIILSPEYGIPNKDNIQLTYLNKTGRYCVKCGVFTAYRETDNCWFCPECGRLVGCYANTDFPMGCVATSIERNTRISVHRLVDRIWKENLMSRKEVYKELSQVLSVPKPYAHIAMMTGQQLEIIKVWARARYKQLTVSDKE